jgi:hypothetical protein
MNPGTQERSQDISIPPTHRSKALLSRPPVNLKPVSALPTPKCKHQPKRAKGLCQKCYYAAYNATRYVRKGRHKHALIPAESPEDRKRRLQRDYRALHRERIRETDRAWRKKNPDKVEARNRKRRRKWRASRPKNVRQIAVM